MHALVFGSSHMMKERTISKLGYSTRTSCALVTTGRALRSSSVIIWTVNAMLNWISQNTEKWSVGFGLCIDFSKAECSTKNSGIFTENCSLSMLEAYDFQAIDTVSSSPGAFYDASCGTDDAQITSVYAKHVDVFIFMFQTFCSPGWTEAALEELSTNIIEFKKSTFQALAKFQVPQLGTHKWHCLHHVYECIHQAHGGEWLHGGLFEISRKQFEETCA